MTRSMTRLPRTFLRLWTGAWLGLTAAHALAAAELRPLAPEVRLEVTLRGRRIRLTRSPQWERPKQRGTGTVAQPAKVLLEELASGDWATLSTRLDETGDLVGPLLGLRIAQFCQVVLLPQNQFAEFLRADAEKRRDLLESLFDTRRFAEVERWLVAVRKDAARDLEAVDQRLGIADEMKPTSCCQPGNGRKISIPHRNENAIASSGTPRAASQASSAAPSSPPSSFGAIRTV